MSRPSIRLRVTLAFAGAMLIVLTIAGIFLYNRFEVELNRTIDRGLRAHAQDVAGTFDPNAAGPPSSVIDDGAEGFAEVLDHEGDVVAASPAARGRVELTRTQLRQADLGPISLEADSITGAHRRTRVFAMPLASPGADAGFVVLSGLSTAARDEALEDLVEEMLIVGPAALLLSSFAAFLVASAALRPVEAMRERAALISSTLPDERLPVPKGDKALTRLGDTLNAMLDRLADSVSRQREFVADAGHEMRTPLTNLRAELELAGRGGRSHKEVQAALASATEETDRLSQLAADLLLLAEAEGGDLPLDLRPLPVAELLASAHRRFGRRAEGQGRPVATRCGLDTEVMVDRMRMEQAIGNLLDNALRHGRGRIELSAEELPGRVRIAVTDEGPGFPPDFEPLAFERFSRADLGRRGEGVGLGLSIVASIVAAHGGEVEIERRVHPGATVTIELSQLH